MNMTDRCLILNYFRGLAMGEFEGDDQDIDDGDEEDMDTSEFR